MFAALQNRRFCLRTRVLALWPDDPQTRSTEEVALTSSTMTTAFPL